jgi:hypothetical protein
MKGDFSRIRFNPANQYTAVLKQQGRVDLDSDANEQNFIDGYIDGVINTDVIGQYGGPADNAGFAISIVDNSILIGAGRYYVNGLLVENPTAVVYDNQRWLSNPAYSGEALLAAISSGTSTVQFVLEVWQQLVTGLDDNCLLEPALGQADTTVRLQTVWRVIGSIIPTSAIPSAEAVDAANPVTLLTPCCQFLYKAAPAVHNGILSADTNGSGSECGCQPIAAAGYQGLENQLYRVEIHTGGPVGTATFKWSRENASVVTQITDISGAVLTVSSLGPDANLGFQNNQWVELTDDTYTYAQPTNFPGLVGKPGQIVQIQSVNTATSQVTFASPISGIDINQNPRMRRWDQSGTLATSDGVTTSSLPVPLENGIEVTFWGGEYVTGDYWTIPARTAKGTIEWPPCGSDNGIYQPPSYIQIYDAPLACMALRPPNSAVPQAGQEDFGPYVVSDCRLLFSPLTALYDDTGADAMHVTSASWKNDDVITVDALVQNGLSVTFDQEPTCPWGGGNFQVTMELAAVSDVLVPYQGTDGLQPAGNYPPGTNIFGRTVSAVDPPLGMAVSGTQVSFITAMVNSGAQLSETFYLYLAFNGALGAATPIGFARIRVRLHGSSIYANGPAGNLYLDGSTYSETGTRVADGSPCVSLQLPSGNKLKSSDFDSWFYLAPSLEINGLALELLNSDSNPVEPNSTSASITLLPGKFGNVAGWETVPPNSSTPVGVQAINVIVTFTYPPVAATTVTFQINYSGAASIISLPSPVNVAPGQASVTVPLNIVGNPGVNAAGANVDTVTIGASVAGLFFPVAFTGTPLTLAITGTETFTLGTFGGGIGQIGLSGIKLSDLGEAKNFEAEINKPKAAESEPPESHEPPKP